MNSSYETKVFQVHTEGDRFGFTLAGQYPCQLVKIQHGSPAEKAGLKSGDEVIEVDGVNVEDLKHDLVASFISPSSTGFTSTELRVRRATSGPRLLTTKAGGDAQKSVSEEVSCEPSGVSHLAKVVDRVVEEFKRPPTAVGTPSPVAQRGLDPSILNGSDMASDDELRATFSPDTGTFTNTFASANISTPVRPSMDSVFSQKSGLDARKRSELDVIVSYLGSIDRPTTSKCTSDSLVTHLRTKTNSPVPVMLEISRVGFCLKNSAKQIIVSCPINSLVYVGICPENKQILGLFTENLNMEGKEGVINDCDVAITSDTHLNCSCHVFVIEPRLIRHPNHKQLMDRFQLCCVPDPATGSCQQFPTSSGAILNALYALFKESSTQVASSKKRGCRNESPDSTVVKNLRKATCGLPGKTWNDLDKCSSTRRSCQAEQNGSEEQILCLHLYPLGRLGMRNEQAMDCHAQGDYRTGVEGESCTTASRDYSSVSHISTTEFVTTSHVNHVQVTNMSTQETCKIVQSAPKGSLQLPNEAKTMQSGHKTLVHRRSQSLASNIKNTLDACAAVAAVATAQTVESYSNADILIGNGTGTRPIYHASSATVMACHNVNSVEGKIARWAVSFDRLLEDKTGMNIFRSFLQKEYSEENLIFWLACEKYKTVQDTNELKRSAEEIFETHLKPCATLPVNVESAAIREVEGQLQSPTSELFTSLQYQVYTLMKFDSYTRFLKSELYRQCLVNEIEGKPVPIEKVEETKKEEKEEEESTGTLRRMFSSSSKGKNRKALNKSQISAEADEAKKKSFLPWRGRLKSDQPKRTTNRSSDSQASSTRSSLSSLSDSVFSSNITNSDETLNDSDGKDQVPPSCRVILPNQTLMYLFCKSTRSLKEGLSKLCEKKEYSLPALDLYIAQRKLTKEDLQRKLSRFINKEIVMKQGVLFRLELPNGWAVGIKADGEKTIETVLEPILRQSGFDIKSVNVRLRHNMKLLSTSASISPLHQHSVVVEEHSGNPTRNPGQSEESKENEYGRTLSNNKNTSTRLGPIMSEDAVFDAIMAGKRQSMSGFSFDENGVFISEVRPAGSKESLSSIGREKERFTRSPALFRKKKRDISQSVSTFTTFVVEEDRKNAEELFSLLRRAQNSRIDDQRGVLDKKIELPDFLKLPEKTNKRNTVLNVGVPSPRAQHQPLKKCTSSPPAYMPCANPKSKPQPAVIAEKRETNVTRMSSATVTRNWSGSSLTRGRGRVEMVAGETVNETQTIDRRKFFKPSTQDGNRLRAGSLPQDHPGDRLGETVAGNHELIKGRSRYYYGSQSSADNNCQTQAVWVSNPTNRNRRRGTSKKDQSADGRNESQTDDEGGTRSKLGRAEVIIPETSSDASRFAISGGVAPYCDRLAQVTNRPKPITDSGCFREFLEASNLQMPTPGGPSKRCDLDAANDREAIFDNSFLREHLKPSRLFSQLTPNASTPVAASSPCERGKKWNEDATKCPLFIPHDLTIASSVSPPVVGSNLESRENHGGSTTTSHDAYEGLELESSRHAYWGLSNAASDEEAIRVTFV